MARLCEFPGSMSLRQVWAAAQPYPHMAKRLGKNRSGANGDNCDSDNASSNSPAFLSGRLFLFLLNVISAQ